MAEEIGNALESALAAAEESRTFMGISPTDDSGDTDDTATDEGANEAEASGEGDTEEAEDKSGEKTDEVREPLKFKYATHEEAEKGYKEAEHKMNEALEAKRATEEQLSSFKSQIEELQNKTQEAGDRGEMTVAEVKELDTVFETMLSDIDNLDPDSDGYKKELAKIWAKGISDALQRYDVARDSKEKTVRAKETEKEKQGRAIEEKRNKVIVQANERATKSGLDMTVDGETPSVDYELFWTMVSQSEGKTVEERIDWSIKEVKRIKSAIVGKREASSAKAKEAQNKNKVLEKGAGRVVTGKEDKEPLSLSEALRRTERRL